MDNQARPHWRQGREDLGARELVAVISGDGLGGGVEQNRVVTGFADSEREDVPVHRVAQDPVGGRIARAVQTRAQPHDDLVHVEGERGCWRGLSKRALNAGDLGNAHTRSAKGFRNQHGEVPGCPQVFHVLETELIVRVIAGCTFT